MRSTGIINIDDDDLINKEDIQYITLCVTGLSTNVKTEINVLNSVNADIMHAIALQEKCTHINDAIINALTSIEGITYKFSVDKHKAKNTIYRKAELI